MKKAASLLLGGLSAAVFLAGCGKEGGSSGEKDIVELTWILSADAPKGLDAWLEKANEYLAEEIGVKLNLEFQNGNQINTIRQSNSGFDIAFTQGIYFYDEQKVGSYLDIAPYLDTVGKEMYDSIPTELWDAMTVNGGIYGVPVYKDSSMTFICFWDADVCEEYDIDYTQFTSMQSPGLTEALLKIREGTGEAPLFIQSKVDGLIETKYDSMNLCNVLGVAYGDKEGKVVSVYEQQDVLDDLKVVREWYEKGIINSDANIIETVPDYKVLTIIQAWPSYADTLAELMGCNVGAVQWGNSVMSNTSISACLNAVSSNCKNPEKAVEFINFVNTDTKFRDMLKYGTEGENFKYNDDGTVTRINMEWMTPNYEIGNFFVNTPEDAEGNQMADIKRQNENALSSVGVGLIVDTSNFEDQLANCNEIYNRYWKDLLTGAVDPDKVVPEMIAELKAAGLDSVIEQVQAQVDAHISK